LVAGGGGRDFEGLGGGHGKEVSSGRPKHRGMRNYDICEATLTRGTILILWDAL
jgi:hypothetical protein